jgi:transposase-like protein
LVSLIEHERIPRVVMLYAVYVYFQGLSLRAVSACLEDIYARSHVSNWNWVQRFSHLNDCFTVRHVRCFMVDETWIRVGSQEAWLWLAFEPYGRFFLGFYLSRTRNILTAELFLQSLIDRYDRRPVYSDEADWYPAACRSLELEHHDAIRGNLMERFVQYVKDPTEGFDAFHAELSAVALGM